MCRQMSKAGVCLRYAVDDNKPTGTCCLCFVAGVRSSTTDVGASKELSPAHLHDDGTRALMDRAVCLYIECYQLGCCFDVLHDVGTYALYNDRRDHDCLLAAVSTFSSCLNSFMFFSDSYRTRYSFPSRTHSVLFHFYPRDVVSGVFATATATCPSVCLSVCLSRYCV